MRRIIPLVLVCAAVLLADDKEAKRKSIEAKKKAVDSELAQKRAALADWCANKGLLQEAENEYNAAIALVGSNDKWAKERDLLQLRRGGRGGRGGRNRDVDPADRQEYEKQKKALLDSAGKTYAELAKQAKEAGLDDLASALEGQAGGAFPPAANPAPKDPPDSPPKKGGKVAPPVYSTAQAWERVNFYRQLAGLDAVAIDDDLSKGAAAHASYLSVNHVPPGLGAHDEKEGDPGYTPEGKAAGQASDIEWGPPAGSVDELMSELFHRIPILRPSLAKIGVGQADGGHITVIDLTQGIVGNPDVERVIAFPVPDQKDVPTHFGSESPDPIPSDASRPAGYPVTLTQYDRSFKVTEATATLVEGDGIPVEVHFSTPEKPAHEIYQLNTIAMIPARPLKSGTKYTAHVTCKMGGVPFDKTWSFTTK